MKLTIFGEQAIKILRPNARWGTANGVLDYQDDDRPEDSEIIQKAEELELEFSAQEYARNRKAEYPDMGTQFNKIYDDGIDAWKTDMVDPIKAKYPKP
jgi:hypothetical protein